MSATITLSIAPRRPLGRQTKHLRTQGKIPGVLYGFEVKNQPVECAYQDFHKVYVSAGESTVIDLAVEGKTIPVLIHAIEWEPVTGKYAHVDFLALDMTKEVTTHVPVHTVGEAPGVKELGGVLVRNRDTLTVRCLPKHLPHAIEIDITILRSFHDTITVAALRLPPNVKIEEKPEEIVLSLIPPRKEEEAAPAATAEGAVAGATQAEGEAAATQAAAAPEAAERKEEKKEKKGK